MIKLFKRLNERYDEFDNMCYWSSLRSTNKIQLMFYILAPRTLLMLVGVILAFLVALIAGLIYEYVPIIIIKSVAILIVVSWITYVIYRFLTFDKGSNNVN